jgi:hypothetical protein
MHSCPTLHITVNQFMDYHGAWRKVKLSLCLTNEALRHEGVWGSGCIEPHFLDLGTSFTPCPFPPRGKSTHSRYGRRVEKKILDPTGTRTPTPR